MGSNCFSSWSLLTCYFYFGYIVSNMSPLMIGSYKLVKIYLAIKYMKNKIMLEQIRDSLYLSAWGSFKILTWMFDILFKKIAVVRYIC